MSTKITDHMLKGTSIRTLLQRAAAEAGFNLVDGSFEEGAVVTDSVDVIWFRNEGTYYAWGGTLPKVVPASSTPATAGGVGVGAWSDKTDLMLRSDINIIQKRYACVADMVADTTLTVGKIVETIGYYNGYWGTSTGAVGGNRYEIVASGTGTSDGGSFITLSNGLQAKGISAESNNIYNFGAKVDGTTDDTVAVQSRINYSQDGAFSGVLGTLLIKSITLPNNTNLSVGGGNLVVNIVPGYVGFIATSKSNIRFSKFKIVGAGSFVERNHLISLNGVSNVIIEDMTLSSPQGDHIYLGAGDASNLNNYNVKIINSRFTGNGFGGRNAISIIDVNDLDIFGNTFDGCSRSGMPGDIDFEPNSAAAVLKNIKVHHNIFKNSRGSTSMVGFVINVGSITQSNYSNINIHNNTFNTPINAACSDFYVDFNTTSWTVDSTIPVINYNDNYSSYTGIPHIIKSSPYLRMKGNTYIGQAQSSLFGMGGVKGSIYRIDIKDDYISGATSVTYGWRFVAFTKLKIEGCVFGVVGNGSTNSAPIAFVNGSSDSIDLLNNEFTDSSSASLKHVYQSAHTFTKTANRTRGNKFATVKMFDLPAYDNDGLQEYGNGYDANELPSKIPVGTTLSLINSGSAGLPSNFAQGTLISYKQNGANGFVRQEFHPRDNGGSTLETVKIFRAASNTSDTWDGFYQLTGTLVT